jgi:heme exporter protein D
MGWFYLLDILSTMRDFFSMGGYAFYVWTAYGLAAVVLLGVLGQSLAWHKRVMKRLDQRLKQ